MNSHYKGANAALIVFDITDRESFFNASRWLKELREHANSTC